MGFHFTLVTKWRIIAP